MPIYEYQTANKNIDIKPRATHEAQSPFCRHGSKTYLPNTTNEDRNTNNPNRVENENVLPKGLL
jgi:hypothetical protein